MEKSTSSDELTVRNQFDRICKMALKSEVTDYIRHRNFAAMMLFLIMILPAIVRSEEDGAIPMGPHLMATCRIILNVCQ